MAVVHDRERIEQLGALEPEALLSWAAANSGDRAAIFTSFQNTGCVMLDMAHRVAPDLRVVTVDTLRLPDETYRFIETVEAHYCIRVERFEPDPDRVRTMVERYGEYLFFDGREFQEHCCHIRKVEPHDRALETVDVWIAGLRRDQSETRSEVAKAAFVEQGGRRVLKLCPLADWTEDQVWAYIEEKQAPYNPLYDMGYTSIGCRICTTPTKPGEDNRAGRWRWFNRQEDEHHKECGIHLGGSGI